jgi:unsaturated rhamnogalacturonyl hydrolase
MNRGNLSALAACIACMKIALVLLGFPAFALGEELVKLAVSAVTASGYQAGNPPANTLDANLSTRWSAEGDGRWITYDLGTSKTVGLVKIAWYKGNERRSTFDIQVSSDGARWTFVVNRGHSSGTTTDLEHYDFPDVTARYVRIVGHGNTSNMWNSLTEVEIYGAGTRRPPDLFDPASIRAKMKNVFDYQLANMRVNWVNRGSSEFWIGAAFYTGVMAAYWETFDQEYLDEALRWSAQNAWQPGYGSRGRDLDRGRHADNHCACQTYLEVYFEELDPRMKQACQDTMDAMLAAERPGRVDWWWVDALYMAPPVLTRLYEATNDAEYVEYLHRMWWDVVDYLYDAEHSLFYRDNRARGERTASGQKVFWGRGNGWMMGGIVRVLQYLPADDPKRQQYVDLLRDMAAAVVGKQGADGLWRASLLDPAQFPAPETSSTGFFTYALAWGINNGILARNTYLPVVAKAWEGLSWATTNMGKVGWCQPVGRAPGPTNAESSYPYCSGAFLLAASEVIALFE